MRKKFFEIANIDYASEFLLNELTNQKLITNNLMTWKPNKKRYIYTNNKLRDEIIIQEKLSEIGIIQEN